MLTIPTANTAIYSSLTQSCKSTKQQVHNVLPQDFSYNNNMNIDSDRTQTLTNGTCKEDIDGSKCRDNNNNNDIIDDDNLQRELEEKARALLAAVRNKRRCVRLRRPASSAKLGFSLCGGTYTFRSMSSANQRPACDLDE